MWRPPVNFVTLHYAYIISMSLLALPVLYPEGNMSAVDALFFGASASTESGLNTIDVKDLRTYQQLYVYFVPMLTNLGFVNIVVIVVRLIWFRKKLKEAGPSLLKARNREDPEAENGIEITGWKTDDKQNKREEACETDTEAEALAPTEAKDANGLEEPATRNISNDNTQKPRARIAFDPSADPQSHPKNDATLYIPGPRDRDRGHPFLEIYRASAASQDDLQIERVPSNNFSIANQTIRRRRFDAPRLGEAKSLERVADVASSMFVFGSSNNPPRERRPSTTSSRNQRTLNDMPFLSEQVTIGRNSQFKNLTSRDREELGGIEYRSLKLLLKIVVSYFFGLHIFGVICLVGWIQHANPKYAAYIHECGQSKNWWALFSAQTMVDNLGLTLTPDSMVSFRDAAWPMFIMSFLAFAGNTLYPVFLRLILWTTAKAAPRRSSIQAPLAFLLNHPRRCYTLLFPSGTTWALFGIIFALNFIDTLLIIVLDLHNPTATSLPVGPRVLAAIFQAASSRHTGTSSFNLADVSPAVQLSLLVMMYIAVFPIALSIRASNTYEEKSLGVYEDERTVDEERGSSYLLQHMQNQLSFDLWYIFLGIFCIAIAEADKVMDPNEPAFALFPIFFEVTSAYGNVGLSLGYPTTSTSLSGQFSTFSKVVICAMMIRGRHRGLPYQLDRAIMLPNEKSLGVEEEGMSSENSGNSNSRKQ